MTDFWDCVIVGGGAAGLSAALVLGRARKRTLVVDAGAQSNLPAHGIGGLLRFRRRPPAELYARGRGELGRYPSVQVRDAEVGAVVAHEGGFTAELSTGVALRLSTVRSATDGKSGTSHWRCSRRASARCTWRGSCGGGATMWYC